MVPVPCTFSGFRRVALFGDPPLVTLKDDITTSCLEHFFGEEDLHVVFGYSCVGDRIITKENRAARDAESPNMS